MAHFIAEIEGNRGPASRLGSANSGITATAASWQGAVRTELYARDGVDCVHVYLMPWRGAGVHQTLYEGPVGAYAPVAGPLPTVALAA